MEQQENDKERAMAKKIESLDRIAAKAMDTYQQTGEQRYLTKSQSNEELADWLRQALNANEEHRELYDWRWIVADIIKEWRNGLMPRIR